MNSKESLAVAVCWLLVTATVFLCVGAFLAFGRGGFFVAALACLGWAFLLAAASKNSTE